jgi:hypothetical protein
MPSDDKGNEERHPVSQHFCQFVGLDAISEPDDCLSVIRNGRRITVVREGNILRVILKNGG